MLINLVSIIRNLSYSKSSFSKGLTSILFSLLLLFTASIVSRNEQNVFSAISPMMIGPLSIPGETKIESLPPSLPVDKRLAFILDTQIVSSHAKLQKAPFLKRFQYQFNIPYEVEYTNKDNSTSSTSHLLSSNDPLLLMSTEEIKINGQEYLRIPLFTIESFDSYQSITIRFSEDETFASSLFESALFVMEYPISLLKSFIIPIILFIGSLLFFLRATYLIMKSFFHRNLEPNEQSYMAALFFSMIFGLFGLDRFYLGYPIRGTIKALSLGGLGLWYFYDLFLIASGKLKDSSGKPLVGSGHLFT